MAIVEMKRIAMLAMREDQEKLLQAMQRMGCVHISEPEDGAQAMQADDQAALDRVNALLAQLDWAIRKLGLYDTAKKQMFAQPPEMDESALAGIATNREMLMDIVAQAEACERRLGELRSQETRNQASLAQLAPYERLDVPVEALRATRETVQMIGSVQTREMSALRDALAGQEAVLQLLNENSDESTVWIIAHRSAVDAVREGLKQTGFTMAQFPLETGTPKAQTQIIEGDQLEIIKERMAITDRYRELATELPALKALFDALSVDQARYQAAQRFEGTQSTFYLSGWVPAARADKAAEKLRRLSPSCVIELREPQEGEEPPVLLKNSRWATPFESIVTGYSLPSYYGLDPTTVMTPFFVCLFGMMLSDAGYGLVLAIGVPLILKVLKIKNVKLPWVLFGGGLLTVFWGAMFDTWFGASIYPMLLNPLTDTLPMMILCLGMGIIHLFAGLGVAAYMNIKRGKPWDALFDQGLWVALILGLIMLVIPQTAAVGKVMALTGLIGILLTAGRANRNPIKRLMGGLGALYNATGWLSDILSYLRLFGMGLATGVVGMVINTLCGMMMTNFVGIVIAIPILIFGHAFNMAINALGAYVHACRLQYIEFFGKFYEDGGAPFVPLRQATRYVALRALGADE